MALFPQLFSKIIAGKRRRFVLQLTCPANISTKCFVHGFCKHLCALYGTSLTHFSPFGFAIPGPLFALQLSVVSSWFYWVLPWLKYGGRRDPVTIDRHIQAHVACQLCGLQAWSAGSCAHHSVRGARLPVESVECHTGTLLNFVPEVGFELRLKAAAQSSTTPDGARLGKLPFISTAEWRHSIELPVRLDFSWMWPSFYWLVICIARRPLARQLVLRNCMSILEQCRCRNRITARQPMKRRESVLVHLVKLSVLFPV